MFGATTSLEPGQMAIFTVTYAVTQAHVDHGTIADTATATGTTPNDATVTGASDPVTIDVTQSPALSITKSASPTTVTMAGQTIDYTFTEVNTGNVTLIDVGVTDHPTGPAGAVTPTCVSLSSPAGTCSGVSTTLVPGQSATFTGTYTVTAADFAHGSMADTATTTGTPPSGGTTTVTSSPVTVEVTHISVVKSANQSGGVVAGTSTRSVYTLQVTNVGIAATTEPVVVTDVPPAGTSLVPIAAVYWWSPGLRRGAERLDDHLDDPGGRRRRGLLHPHLLGDGGRVAHERDDHQHGHLERAELRAVCGHDLPDRLGRHHRLGPVDHPVRQHADLPEGNFYACGARGRVYGCALVTGVGGRRPRRGRRGHSVGRSALAQAPSPSRCFQEIGLEPSMKSGGGS